MTTTKKKTKKAAAAKSKRPEAVAPDSADLLAELVQAGAAPAADAPITNPNVSGETIADNDAKGRAKACGEEIQRALTKYSCRIVPSFEQPVPVGTSGSIMQITASVTLAADPMNSH